MTVKGYKLLVGASGSEVQISCCYGNLSLAFALARFCESISLRMLLFQDLYMMRGHNWIQFCTVFEFVVQRMNTRLRKYTNRTDYFPGPTYYTYTT